MNIHDASEAPYIQCVDLPVDRGAVIDQVSAR